MMGIIVGQVGVYYVISRPNMKAMKRWKFQHVFGVSEIKDDIWWVNLQFTVPTVAEMFISGQ